RLKAKKAEIKEITNNDLGIDPKEIGLEGSFTRVVKIFEPTVHEAGEVVEGTPDELVEALFKKLQECKVI
ncbi:electron transfer flavoprotein subunit beta, partial [archaeon]|nr:electron transfer flavoprotein subunit beta [archaeon]